MEAFPWTGYSFYAYRSSRFPSQYQKERKKEKRRREEWKEEREEGEQGGRKEKIEKAGRERETENKGFPGSSFASQHFSLKNYLGLNLKGFILPCP